MIRPADDEQSVTTALSTLSARVAVLERWMRKSRRDQAILITALAIVAIVFAVLLVMR
jgi:hypothetical protein